MKKSNLKNDDRTRKPHPALETIKARVQERVNAANLSRNEASRRANLGLSYVNDLLADKSKNPTRESLAKLGSVLDTDVAYFFGEQDVPRKSSVSSDPAPAHNEAPAGSIPLYHVGLSDPDGFFKLDEARKTPMQSPIAGPGVYCVAVPDDTMAPRYRAGEVVVVNPNRPVARGGFAIIRQTDGRVAIREVVSIAPDKVVVRALNDEKDVDLPRQGIGSLDRIVAGCDLT